MYSFGERFVLVNGDLVVFFNMESGRDVGGEVFVVFFVMGVFGDVVEVFVMDDDGVVYFGGDDGVG